MAVSDVSPRDSGDRLPLLMCGGALAALVFSFLGYWLAFGLIVWLMLTLAIALGLGPQSKGVRVVCMLGSILAIYWTFLLGIASTDDPGGTLRLFLGLPLPTAIFVYGVWPCGALPGVVYAIEFRHSVVRNERLERFLREHGRQQEAGLANKGDLSQ